jgi:hypothetical protein
LFAADSCDYRVGSWNACQYAFLLTRPAALSMLNIVFGSPHCLRISTEIGDDQIALRIDRGGVGRIDIGAAKIEGRKDVTGTVRLGHMNVDRGSFRRRRDDK